MKAAAEEFVLFEHINLNRSRILNGICLNKLTIFHFLRKSNTRARSVHGMSIWDLSQQIDHFFL
jgi:hypothetical protein